MTVQKASAYLQHCLNTSMAHLETGFLELLSTIFVAKACLYQLLAVFHQ